MRTGSYVKKIEWLVWIVQRTNLSISFTNELKFMVFFQKTCNTLAAGFRNEIKYLFQNE